MMNQHRKSVSFFRGFTARMLLLGGASVLGLLAPVAAAQSGQQTQTQNATPTAEQAAFFKQSIQPILVNHCLKCHSAATRASAQLRLDDHDALLKGGKSGPAITLGNPDDSLLIHRVLGTDPAKARMPRGEASSLSDKEIADLKAWIAQGAPWPADAVLTGGPAQPSSAQPSSDKPSQ